jgi:hypothetical protein
MPAVTLELAARAAEPHEQEIAIGSALSLD